MANLSKNAYYVNIDGSEIQAVRILNCVNGNPRYVVHFSSLGIELEEYDIINKLYGFTRYRGRSFGGGVVFQSYNLYDSIEHMKKHVRDVKIGRYKR